ncbi:MAG TPA: hypothetical protein VFK76_03015 [Gaiellaceae bacterium]|nr:hypothetical protein [Gaiellaceae bacterium]
MALIGPDGAGKTTIARRLESSLPMPVKYLYMGVNPEGSNHLLPTTRLLRKLKRARGVRDDAGPPDPDKLHTRPQGALGRTRASVKSSLRLGNRLAEEWYRQWLAWRHLRHGTVVLFDRHFFADYYAYDIARGKARPLSRRIHGVLLAHAYPQPDLVVYLDAPAEVLLARKGEGTIELLERRRRDYLELAGLVRNFASVDADRPLDEVSDEVAARIEAFARSRGAGARGAEA